MDSNQVKALKARIRELERRDPLKDNDVLLRAVEVACGVISVKNRYRSPRLLDGNLDYTRRFAALAIDPSITVAEIARRMKITPATAKSHLEQLGATLQDWVEGVGHQLRSREDGWGVAKEYDQEELVMEEECQQLLDK